MNTSIFDAIVIVGLIPAGCSIGIFKSIKVSNKK
jgi:hypothetical protein